MYVARIPNTYMYVCDRNISEGEIELAIRPIDRREIVLCVLCHDSSFLRYTSVLSANESRPIAFKRVPPTYSLTQACIIKLKWTRENRKAIQLSLRH